MRQKTGFRITANWPWIIMDQRGHHIFLTLPCFSCYWLRFYVNIMTGSGAMTIFVYKGLTRNPEIGKTPLCILPNI